MKKNKIHQIKWTLGLLIAVFLLLIAFFAVPMGNEIRRMLLLPAASVGVAFFILGILLMVYAVKQKIKGKLKWFLILTGASSAAMFPSVILHNVAYGLFIYLFGADFWGEGAPFFFIFGLVICPLVFIVGAAGSAVLLKRKT